MKLPDGCFGALCSVGIYIATYLAWGEGFRARIDPWMRARVGRILGTTVVARQDGDGAFSIPLWRSAGPTDVERNAFFGLVSSGWLLLGAFTPILGLTALCFFTTWMGEASRAALYLMSSAFLIVFLVQQMRRKGHAPETRDEAALSSSHRDLLRLPREEDS